MNTWLQYTGSFLQFGYSEYSASIHWVPLTMSSVTMSTVLQYTGSRLQTVRLQQAQCFNTLGPAYKQFSYSEYLTSIHWVPLTMSFVTTSTWLQYTGSHLQTVWLQWVKCFNTLGPTYKQFGYSEHSASIHWVLLPMSSVTMSTVLQYTGSHLQTVQLQWAQCFNTLGPAYKQFGYSEYSTSIHWVSLTMILVTTSTWLQYTGSCLQTVQLQRAQCFNKLGHAYNEFSYNEHPVTQRAVFFCIFVLIVSGTHCTCQKR